MSEDLWERHARWWIDGFTDGADPEYTEQILPLAASELAGAQRVLDIGCGDGQIARLLAADGAAVVGIDPTWNQISVGERRTRAPVPTHCRSATRRSTPPSRVSCSNTSTPSTPRSPRWRGSCGRAGASASS
jgi:SAM-dependent methyltransferase